MVTLIDPSLHILATPDAQGSDGTAGQSWDDFVRAFGRIAQVVFADTPYTATITAPRIEVDCTGGNIVINLPAAANAKGIPFEIVKVDTSTNKVTITPNGAEQIDGINASVELLAFGKRFHGKSNGGGYFT